MPTIEEIDNAIRIADKAGRAADVQALAKARQALISQGGGGAVAPAAQAPAAAVPAAPPAAAEPAAQPGFFDLLKERLAGGGPQAQRPEWWNQSLEQANPIEHPMALPQALNDMVRIGANAVTLNAADRLEGAMPWSGGVEQERAVTQQGRDRAGWAAPAMDVTSSVAMPGGAAKYLAKGKGFLQSGLRMAGDAAEAALTSGTAAYNAGEDAVSDALGGAGISTAVNAVARPFAKVWSRLSGRNAPGFKDTSEIKDAAKSKYQSAEKTTRDTGAVYPKAVTGELANAFDDILEGGFAVKGVDDRPMAFAARFRELAQNGDLDPIQLEKLRGKISKQLIRGNQGQDAAIGREMLNEVDRLTTAKNVSPVDMRGTKQPSIQRDIEAARGLESRFQRSRRVDKAVSKAERRSQTTGSSPTGGNLENTRRQEFSKIDEDIESGKAGGYDPDVAKRIKKIAEGSLGRNVGRFVAGVAPMRGAVPVAAHILSGGMTLPFGVMGEVANALTNKATAKQIDEIQQLVRNGKLDPKEAANRLREMAAKASVGAYRGREREKT